MLNRAQKKISVFCAISSLLFAFLAISSVKTRTPTIVVASDGVIDVPVDALAVSATTDAELNLVCIPRVANQLHGRRVRIHGIMWLTFDATGLTEFTLIPETDQRPVSWLSRNIPLHATIPVEVVSGQTEDYQEAPITVEGKFEICVRIADDKVFAIYRMTDARIVAKKVLLHHPPAVYMFGC